MQTFFLFALIVCSVVAMVIAISRFKLHPFIVLTVVAILVGLIWGIDPETVVNTVKTGFGSILTSIGIVILCGTIIGTILEKTGAALTMANFILRLVGKKNSVVAIGAMGYVTGIPVFCDSGFVVLSPISRALAQQSNTSLAVMATALSGGLYATHSRPHRHGGHLKRGSGAYYPDRPGGFHPGGGGCHYLCKEGFQPDQHSG